MTQVEVLLTFLSTVSAPTGTNDSSMSASRTPSAIMALGQRGGLFGTDHGGSVAGQSTETQFDLAG